MKDKRLVVFAAICLVFVLLSVYMVTNTFTVGEKNGEAFIESVHLWARDYREFTVPDTVRSYLVTSIHPRAFEGCGKMQSLTLPESITVIDASAFLGCTQLESVTLPDSVTEIGRWAFSECTQLKELKIPESVTVIGEGAFSYDTTLLVYPGSYAEKYAEENGYTYEVIKGTAGIS